MDRIPPVFEQKKCDALIIGCGVVGLATGIALIQRFHGIKVIIAEKEESPGLHASGRNSGVLHAGFYYSPESLKARFCREGNSELRQLTKKFEIPFKEVGKVVIARDDSENLRLQELFERGLANNVDVELLPEEELNNYEPLAKTRTRFLWSPTTGISDPHAVLIAMCNEFTAMGGEIHFSSKVKLGESNNEIVDTSGKYLAGQYINASGAQSDRIAHEIGIGTEYAMLPFMGIYRATKNENLPLKRLVYPVPHLINPFLGVHFTLTIDGKTKIGPTAIPVFGREHYTFNSGWSTSDTFQSLKSIKALVSGEAHDFKSILKSEVPKVFQSLLIKESAKLVPAATSVSKWLKLPPGIRAQLVNLTNGELVQDFIVKNYLNSTHILNAVSPGWTSAFPFGRYVASQIDL